MGEEENKQNTALTDESDLQRTIGLVSFLISISYSIKAFHVKWQLIRNRLEDLNCALVAAKNCENPLLSQLVPEILSTVNDSYDLARRCSDVSYSGKLLMQSDLDVVSAKFEVHLRNLDGIYSTGILTDSYALVVSRPTRGAPRDDMKFYVRDLFTRLKIGGPEMKIQALVALNEVVTEDKKHVKIVVEIGESIALLVNFLEFEEMEIREEAMKVIVVIAGIDCYRSVLVGAGIIPSLIRALEFGSGLGKEQAARALNKLTENSDNAWSISAQDGVTTLLKMCTKGSGESELIGLVCGVLKNLAGVEEIKRFIVEEGAVMAIIKLLRSKDDVLQINAIEFLQVIASCDKNIHQMINKQGGIQPLVSVLDPTLPFSSKARKTALLAIGNFFLPYKNSQNILMASQFLDHLLFCLRSNDTSLQELAIRTVSCLCNTSEETKKAMGAAGFMTELVTLLNVKSSEVREMVGDTLLRLLGVTRNRRRFLQDDCNVERIMQLLDPDEGKLGNKRFLLSSLMSLTRSKSGRKKIGNSSNLKNLEKLAEVEVVDAKKIISKLSSNRFRIKVKLQSSLLEHMIEHWIKVALVAIGMLEHLKKDDFLMICMLEHWMKVGLEA